ncbi:MAG: sigma-70 family RNA polymerase sigma factor [Proteobacteria bacterium]|nr:sigma-70 family RNA polymerase sigma factor [Pseudomonadota bacterium]
MKIEFEALYRDHYRRVFGLCRRLLGRSTQAEDAAQEVFVRAYRSLDRYDTHQPFAAWILSIAANHCVDLLRSRARDGKLFDEFDTEIDVLDASAPGALDTLVDEQRSAEIRGAIAALPDKYRLPIVLAYYNDANYDEIAHALGVTRNHVGVLLLRAKQLLRHSLAASQEES